MIKDSGMFSMN